MNGNYMKDDIHNMKIISENYISELQLRRVEHDIIGLKVQYFVSINERINGCRV